MKNILYAIIMAFCLPCSTLYADAVYLNSGGILRGEILSETETIVVIKMNSIEITVKKSNIRSIERSEPGTTRKNGVDPEKLITEGKKRLKDGDFDGALKTFKTAGKRARETDDLKKLVDLAGQLQKAADALEKEYLKKAAQYARKALEIEPGNTHALKIISEVEAIKKKLGKNGSLEGDFRVLKTRHFTIHHYNPVLAGEVAEAAEKYYAYLLEKLSYDGAPRVKTEKYTIRIHRNRQEFILKGEPDAKYCHAYVKQGKTLEAYQSAVLGCLKHETTHLVLHTLQPMMPAWIQEGFATGGYLQADTPAYKWAKQCIDKNTFLPMDKFLLVKSVGSLKNHSMPFYIQARMLVEYLLFVRGDMRKFHGFCGKARRRMRKKLDEHYKNRSGRIKIRISDWITEPIRQCLKEEYGYAKLTRLDDDLKAYVQHRLKEAPCQARLKNLKYTVSWKYKHKLESEHFVVFSNLDRKMTGQILDLQENVYSAVYRTFFDAGMTIPGKIRIFLFNRKREMADQLEKDMRVKIKDTKTLLPQFNPFNNTAYIYKEGKCRHSVFKTTAHEITHGMSVSLMQLYGSSGYWVVEGIAHYVGASVIADTRRVRLGNVYQVKDSMKCEYIKLMQKKNDVVPLKEFVSYKISDFNTVHRHVQCWALFHFLMHGEDGVYRDGLIKYLKELITTQKGGVEVFEKHIDKISAIEGEFLKYISRIEPTAKK